MRQDLGQRSLLVLFVGLSLLWCWEVSNDSRRLVRAEDQPTPAISSSPLSPLPTNPAWRVSRAECDAPTWRQAIQRATQHKALQVGAGEFTLLRVVLEGVEPVTPPYLTDEANRRPPNTEQPRGGDAGVLPPLLGTVPLPTPGPELLSVVNGVRLFFSDAVGKVEPTARVAPSRAKLDIVQVTSTKVVSLKELYGGGVFSELANGDFILIEHINSTRRIDGRDPVKIGSFTHHAAEFTAQVPPRGQLGILGDVILSRPQPEAMGQMELDLRFVGNDWRTTQRLPMYQLQLGPCVVGGAYGVTRDFNHDNVCHTGPLPPGEYNLLLPDFDMIKSRWTVRIKPGQITRIRFEASAPKSVQLVEETWTERPDKAP